MRHGKRFLTLQKLGTRLNVEVAKLFDLLAADPENFQGELPWRDLVDVGQELQHIGTELEQAARDGYHGIQEHG